MNRKSGKKKRILSRMLTALGIFMLLVTGMILPCSAEGTLPDQKSEFGKIGSDASGGFGNLCF